MSVRASKEIFRSWEGWHRTRSVSLARILPVFINKCSVYKQHKGSRRYICSYDIPLSAPLSPRCTLSTKNIQKRVEELRRFQLKASIDFRCTTYVNERAFTVVEFVDCDREAGGAARDPSAYSQYRAPRHLKDRKA